MEFGWEHRSSTIKKNHKYKGSGLSHRLMCDSERNLPPVAECIVGIVLYRGIVCRRISVDIETNIKT